MKKITVLLGEDHETIRSGLRLLINEQPDMEVIGEAADGRAAMQRVLAVQPAVVVMDVSMPEMNGLAATRALRERSPHPPAVVALTRYTEDAFVKEMLEAGASAYVLKQSPSKELLNAIRAAAAGREYLDSNLVAQVAGAFVRRHARVAQDRPRITEREEEVLRLMAWGHSNKDIASQLDVSVKTVEVHRANAMRKLGLKGRIDIVQYAVLQGWLAER